MDRVLLVDDEQIDLDGLRLLVDWSSLGMEVVAAVHSTKEALALINKQPIDILITDIKMPMTSGLELARQALEGRPDLKVIFVSGYEDFQYAKQAIAMSASGYVLKPIDDDELNHVLMNVKDTLEYERKQRQVASAYSESVPLVKNELLVNLLEIVDNKEAAQSIIAKLRELGEINLDGPTYAAVLEADDLAWKLNPYSDQERTSLEASLTAAVADFASAISLPWCRLRAFHYGFILDTLETCDHLAAFVEQVGYREEKFPFTATVGVGGCASNGSSLHESYKQACEALEMKMFLGKGKVLQYRNVSEENRVEVKDINQILDDLFAAMAGYQLVRIDDCLLELFQSASGMQSKLTLSHFSLHIVSRLEAHLQTLNENFFEILQLERKNLDILYHFETIDDIQSWLRRRMFHISEHLHLKKTRKNGRLVEEIKRYTEQHLERNITLRDAANAFSFSPNYLGQIFLEETGQYFSDFSTQMRLEKAKQYLQDPTLKIYEAAARVGYRNIAYFSKQFREHFGVTPGEYRKQC